ncbi:hypothetical protein, partial [uncultured Shewanella sp.]|uniref:hypothetical protein n=1 Tax=uncultured Shewanella sp. TaxID=173975 RepID=UPI0026026FA5
SPHVRVGHFQTPNKTKALAEMLGLFYLAEMTLSHGEIGKVHAEHVSYQSGKLIPIWKTN